MKLNTNVSADDGMGEIVETRKNELKLQHLQLKFCHIPFDRLNL